MAAPVHPSQSRAVLSKPAVAIQRPSGLNLVSVHQALMLHHAKRRIGGSRDRGF